MMTRLSAWRGVTLLALLFGYVGYYLCRSNWAVAKPLILEAYKDEGLSIERLGDIESAAILCYAIGKAVNGPVADLLGGRRIFLLGMVLSAIVTLLLGLTGGVAAFLVLSMTNRFVQSMGWGGLLQVVGKWFPPKSHGTVMGILSMSYLLGDALAKAYLGLFAKETNWDEIFFISAGSLAVIAVVCAVALKSSPSEVGLPEQPPPPENVHGTDESMKPSLIQLLVPLLMSSTFLLVCLLNGGLTLIRETFRTWTPTYLVQAADLSARDASLNASLLSVAGAVASLFTGIFTDRLNGRYGLVLVPMLLAATAGMIFLSTLDPKADLRLTIATLCFMSFFILGPYTLCSGVMALGLGGKKGGGTAAGLIDTCGYLAGTLAGSGVARVAGRYGWSAAFEVLAYAAGATALAAMLYWANEIRLRRRMP